MPFVPKCIYSLFALNIRACFIACSVNISDYLSKEIMDWQIIVLILFALATCLTGKKSREENADNCSPFIISR